MTLVGIVVVLVAVGLILWLVNTYIPLQLFGVFGPINGVHIPKLR